jgi:hypothetical protein
MSIMLKLKIHGTQVKQAVLGRYRNQAEVINICRGNPRIVSIGGSHTVCGIECIRAYSINKVRRKFVKYDKPKKWTKKMLKQNGYDANEEKFTYGEEIHPTHWVGVYYDFPVSVLNLLNLTVVQGKHSYKLVPKK